MEYIQQQNYTKSTVGRGKVEYLENPNTSQSFG